MLAKNLTPFLELAFLFHVVILSVKMAEKNSIKKIVENFAEKTQISGFFGIFLAHRLSYRIFWAVVFLVASLWGAYTLKGLIDAYGTEGIVTNVRVSDKCSATKHRT